MMHKLLAVLTGLFLIAGIARADTPALRAYDSVTPVMENVDSDLIEDGVDKDNILDAVTKRLNAADVAVYPDSGQIPVVLDIAVDSIKAPGGKVYAYDVKVSAQTTVAVVAPPYTQTSASIWTVSTIALCNTTDVAASLKSTVLDCTTLFIKEYVRYHQPPQR